MSRMRYVSAELKHIFKNRFILISVCLAVLVPLIYAMIMLSPKWGPYDNTDNLPVAVVNNDLGAISEGEKINIGESLLTSLQENNVLGWEFVTSEEAQNGMKNMQYYMTIEVPQDFSKKALTVLDDDPVKPELIFTQNEGLHFMAAQVTNKAVETLKTQLSTQITATYVENVVSQLKEVANGFGEAADGAKQINDGTGKLRDGSEQILDSLNEKSPDIGRLANGANQLEDGSQTMKESLVSKQEDITRLANGAQELNNGTGILLNNLQTRINDIGRLADGAKQVNDGTSQLLTALNEKSADINRLSNGASQLADGASELHSGSTELLEGAKQAKSGSSQLKDGLNQKILPGSEQLAAGVQQAQAGVNETIESMQNLQAALEQLPNSVDGLENNVLYNLIMGQLNENLKTAPQKQKDFQRLVDGAHELRNGLKNDFNPGMVTLDNGLAQLVEGQQQLQNGASKLAGGSKEVAAGNHTVAAGWKELQKNVAKLKEGTKLVQDGNATVKNGWNDLTAGAQQLHDGSSQVRDGNKIVESGWRELSSGAMRLHDGSSQLSEGNHTVKEGWAKLTDGVSEVDGGLGQLSDGSEELHKGLEGGAEQTSSIDPEEENIAMFAEPVALAGKVINSFSFYRDANAPYILTLALYAGVFALSFAVQYRKPVAFPSSAIAWFTGKTAKLSMLVVIQALIISLYTLFILKLDVQSSISFVLFSIMVSLTFLMIVLFLVGLAGNIGRFLALTFVVLQLSTTGSALPVDMLPEGLRNLSVFLPFTYSINSYRNIITIGNTANMWENIIILFVYFALFVILALLVFMFKYRSLREQANLNNKEEVGESVG
ncbi:MULTISPECIES: YhgE/Pip domain-containing protein [Clostridia]|uniref:YhgE/Pip domain-containing protein n=1 Tax=Clostridia TaxID=186801 RepID=UPI000EA04DF1|nr:MULTISPECIES: YhgE/Pip domain-containing protein [Clostridia]NBJ69590.1 YhgE/Pip domain-containing protein [Roseburia sp. 1XD42-34]RKI78349.1 YhgE/Pip domain-containing protein [Clostridium sp. 1xD42-85]